MPDRRDTPGPDASWTLVLPVKGGPLAKRRLRLVTGTFPALPWALALDCVDAALATPEVGSTLVVTQDADLAALMTRRGARSVGESAPGAGLTAAVADGVAAADHDAPVAVLLADVPCVRPADLSAALAQASRALLAGAPMAMVADAEGTGTVLLAAPRPAALDAHFGPGSAAAHRARGAVEVGTALTRLRRDVDTPAELSAAVALGVGAATAATLSAQPATTSAASGAASWATSTCSTSAPRAASLSAKCS